MKTRQGKQPLVLRSHLVVEEVVDQLDDSFSDLVGVVFCDIQGWRNDDMVAKGAIIRGGAGPWVNKNTLLAC
jgi:hypothetical protein